MVSLQKDFSAELVEKAKEATKRAHAPYSKFHVGAALITEKGNVFTGCNVENASYGLTICAERNAIFAAVNAEGTDMKIKAIAVAIGNNLPGSPCGACRQVISEFSTRQGEKTTVIYPTKDGVIHKTIDELLPGAFEF
jgi:cytidine deaminase